jgi:hypothetical protein
MAKKLFISFIYVVGGYTMFINKILGFSNNTGFKGYQHVHNNVGEQVYRFNYPYDYENETCELQIFDIKEVGKENGATLSFASAKLYVLGK